MIKQIFKSFLFVVLVVPVGLGAMEAEHDNVFWGKALLFVVTKGDPIEVELFLSQRKYDLNQKDQEGKTSLIVAACYDYQKIAQMLIAHQADLNQKDKYSMTALMWAARKGYKEIVQMLINAKADLNLQTKNDEWTALCFAAMHDRKEIVSMLIEAMIAQNKEQKDRIYTFLFCLKQMRGFAKTNLPRDLFKPILLPTIIDVRKEINRIDQNQLLEKYGFQPISSSEAQ